MSVIRYADKASLHEQVDHVTGYHRPNYQETMDAMGILRGVIAGAAHTIVDQVPLSPDLYDAIDHLDDALKSAIAGLARYEPKGQTSNTTSHPKAGGDPQTVARAKELFGFEHVPAPPPPDRSFTEEYPKDAFAPQAFEGAIKKVKDNPQA